MLTFPTIAEQVVTEYNETNTCIAKLAKRRGALIERNYPTITYTFDDDTSIETSGHGKGYRFTTYLP